jgi:endonuclease YncB( thermonuclease family)
MAEFIVSEVIDGDTFKVQNGWKWNERRGDTVRSAGYDTPEKGKPGYEEAKQKL